ncbi:MAG: FAD-binding oxidoreductase [Alphaproteobacteria bacterium]|nr:FAD-binding oxidoreductase [Alphaproteobacteria bacterium]
MSYRRSRVRQERQGAIAQWSDLPDSVFSDLGVDRAELARFADALVGSVVLPGDATYEAASRAAFQISAHRPKIIVYCEIEADVRLCLASARRHGWWVVPRSGGHSTAAYSVNDGMVIDLSAMNHVSVDTEAMAVHVGAGTRFGRLNAALDSHGVHMPGGLCEDVGIAGYMQGGGYGFTAREFGMNCDNVLSFRMMLRDGRAVTANASQNADLFWAVRGGTGNNFGILLEITYRLRRLSPLWAFGLRWEAGDAAAALQFMHERYTRTGASPKIGYMAVMSHRGDLDGRPILAMRGTYNGDADDGRSEIAALLSVGQPTLEVDTSASYHRIESTLFETPAALFDVPDDPRLKEDKQAGYIAKAMTVQDWQSVVDHYVGTTPNPSNLFAIEPYGGAINSVAPDACAFIHRDVDMSFYVDSFWIDDADAAAAISWLDGFMDLMAPHFNGQVFQNYPRSGLDDYKRRYWGENYDRLLAVKNKYDPVPHMFYFEQGVCTSPDDPGVPLYGGAPEDFTAAPIVFEPRHEEPGNAAGA